MSHDLCIENSETAYQASPRLLLAVVALLIAVFVAPIVYVGSTASAAVEDMPSQQIEDWHGNVRRSGWSR